MINSRATIVALVVVLLHGCAAPRVAEAPVCPVARPCPVCPVCPAPAPTPAPPEAAVFEPASYADLPGWRNDDLAGTLRALLASCRRLAAQPAWQAICTEAASLQAEDRGLRAFFETRLAPWRIRSTHGSDTGLVTGYYEPLLHGSRTRRGPYRYPLYAPPDDLLAIDLAEVNPSLRNVRLRGRLEGRRVVPYYSRADIERGLAPLQGKEIVWVDDALQAFFLQIQGSGRVQLDDGQVVRIGYADQNGHPYRSVGRVLVERGELTPETATMQGILSWAKAHPELLPQLLNENPSYVFFRELPQDGSDPSLGPVGALGVPLAPGRSIAVDPRFIPLGAPVYLATTEPISADPLQRLVFAQDTGGAIRGPVRADYFWGFGAEAGERAGAMRQEGRLWLLWPRGHVPAAPSG